MAYDFYLSHPDETLIVVTADHDTGGMALNGKVNLGMADYQRMSKDAMSDYFREMIKNGTPVSWAEMKDFLKAKLGFWTSVKVNDAQNEMLEKAFEKTFVAREGKDEKGLYNSFDEFVNKVFDVMNHRIGTHFTTRSHSANPVPVFAIGKGSELFGTVMNNTEIPVKILKATR